MNSNDWDKVTSRFDTHCTEIEAGVAGNITYVWPEMLSAIARSKYFDPLNPNGETTVLDFGCGTGGFCLRLLEEGYKVVGVDTSSKMLETAKSHSPKEISYFLDGDEKIEDKSPFSFITAIMVLQFVRDLDPLIGRIRELLSTGGLFMFAVHNQDYISKSAQAGWHYDELDSVEKPTHARINFGETSFPLYLRSADEYKKLFEENGFNADFQKLPENSPEYIRKFYTDKGKKQPVSTPKYLVMGFKKLK